MKTRWTDSAADLASSGTRLIPHRVARRAVIAWSLAAGGVALAGGIAIGHYFGGAASAAADDISSTAPLEHHHQHVVRELGQMHASLALLDPRIERLAAQIAELRQFDQRLRAQPARRKAPVMVSARRARGGEGDEGGPGLPPRPCIKAPATQPGERGTQSEIDCMIQTLSALEHTVAQYEAARSAFPSRAPVESGRLGSSFGNRIDPFTRRFSFHSGVDLVAPPGTRILAAAGGRVVHAGRKPGYGNTVEIDHGNGFVTRYGHASKIAVRAGQLVMPLDHIANVGSTGRSTGPHLHYEVLVGGEPVNPADYFARLDADWRG
ncbi:M23 family metallopeptidase [Paraburkholderia denitrificans]|uniref:M23 family metallopeptidase n=1 Tax=Paraburkholderia denitrificans TaxID=694025 RepID=A0ABW0J722_9BURK